MQRLVFIIAGGEMDDLRFLRRQIDRHKPLALICADGGARYLRDLNVTPDRIVGDLDSLEAILLDSYTQRGVEIRRHPPAKDDTDTALALAAACELAPEAVWIFGGLGGRLDHTLANLSLLLDGEARGIPVKFLDRWCEVYLVGPRGSARGRPGQTVSLLPLFGEAQGVTLTGFEYPLTEGNLSMARPIGVSNRLTKKEGLISISSGRLVVIHYWRKDHFPPTKGLL